MDVAAAWLCVAQVVGVVGVIGLAAYWGLGIKSAYRDDDEE